MTFVGNNAHGFSAENARGLLVDAQAGGHVFLARAANSMSDFGQSDYLSSDVTDF